MTTFYCMRHARTDWNDQGRIQGSTDTSINEEGREQARKWAASLKEGGFDLLVCSGLKRARETAEILNETLGLELIEDERLNEMNWGEWTGLDRRELKEKGKLVGQQERKGFAFRAAGGESRDELLMRSCDALMDLTEAHPGTTVLVVTHNGVLKALAYALSGLEYLPGDKCPIEPERLHRFDCAELELAPGELNIEI